VGPSEPFDITKWKVVKCETLPMTKTKLQSYIPMVPSHVRHRRNMALLLQETDRQRTSAHLKWTQELEATHLTRAPAMLRVEALEDGSVEMGVAERWTREEADEMRQQYCSFLKKIVFPHVQNAPRGMVTLIHRMMQSSQVAVDDCIVSLPSVCVSVGEWCLGQLMLTFPSDAAGAQKAARQRKVSPVSTWTASSSSSSSSSSVSGRRRRESDEEEVDGEEYMQRGSSAGSVHR
jgi:hypothetical protein